MSTPIQRHLKQRRAFRSLEEEVFAGLQVVADRIMEPWARRLRETADLTDVQYNVLRILRGAGSQGLWAGEIGERLLTRSPDVTRLVDRLESRGLVSRCRDSGDRRAVRVHITEAGLERIAPLDEQAAALFREILGPVGQPGLQALRETLGAILEVLEKRRPEGTLPG